jgi:hypothetical protein
VYAAYYSTGQLRIGLPVPYDDIVYVEEDYYASLNLTVRLVGYCCKAICFKVLCKVPLLEERAFAEPI